MRRPWIPIHIPYSYEVIYLFNHKFEILIGHIYHFAAYAMPSLPPNVCIDYLVCTWRLCGCFNYLLLNIFSFISYSWVKPQNVRHNKMQNGLVKIGMSHTNQIAIYRYMYTHIHIGHLILFCSIAWKINHVIIEIWQISNAKLIHK